MKQPIMKSLVLAGALTMGIAACSSSPASSSGGTAKGAPLVIVDNTGQTFTRSFNPFVSTSIGNSNNTTALIYEPLLMFNIMQPTQPPIPWLATAYSWSNGGKTLTLTIRKGVKFSDGKPMTASDVAFSFNLLKNNSTLTPVSPPPVPLTRDGTEPHDRGADLQPARVREPVPDRRDVHRPAAHLAGRLQPGDLRRPGPGRHRPVRGLAVLGAEVHPDPEQEVLAEEQGARAVDHLPELRQQRHGQPGPVGRPDRLRRQ